MKYLNRTGGLLIASRPVIIWNVIAILINFLTVGAYAHFLKLEKQSAETKGQPMKGA